MAATTDQVIDYARLGPAEGSRIAVVGGCGGIGARFTEVAVALGLAPVVFDLERSIGLRERWPAPTIPIDVRSTASIDAAFDRAERTHGAFDALVYASGYAQTPPPALDGVAEEAWLDVLDVNLNGAYRVVRRMLPGLARRRGAVVAVSSTLGSHALPGFAPYSAAKAGLEALVRSIAVEQGPAVRANGIAPSVMRTAFISGGAGRDRTPEGDGWFRPEAFLPSIPMGRLAEVDDVIGPMLFLLGPAAGFITGQVLNVSGGRHFR